MKSALIYYFTFIEQLQLARAVASFPTRLILFSELLFRKEFRFPLSFIVNLKMRAAVAWRWIHYIFLFCRRKFYFPSLFIMSSASYCTPPTSVWDWYKIEADIHTPPPFISIYFVLFCTWSRFPDISHSLWQPLCPLYFFDWIYISLDISHYLTVKGPSLIKKPLNDISILWSSAAIQRPKFLAFIFFPTCFSYFIIFEQWYSLVGCCWCLDMLHARAFMEVAISLAFHFDDIIILFILFRKSSLTHHGSN